MRRIRVGTSGYMCRHWRDVFVYFDDDVGGHAVRDALDLLALVGEERPALAGAP